jgi:hypothetical protein
MRRVVQALFKRYEKGDLSHERTSRNAARRNDEIGDLGRLSRELRAYRAHPHARSVARSLTREEGR